MSLRRESTSALAVDLSSTVARPRHVLLMAAGYLVAAVTLAALLGIPAGLDRIAASTGLPDVALVLSASAQGESDSNLPHGAIGTIEALPGVAHDAKGKPLVNQQYVAVIPFTRRDGSSASVLIRGVSSNLRQVADHAIHLTQGQRFQPGTDTLIAGTVAAKDFAGMQPGGQVALRNAPWHVTGEFDAGGGVWNSELWASMASLQSAFNAQGQVSVLWVKLTSPAAFSGFKAAVKANRALAGVRVVMQRKYYAQQIGFLAHFARIATAGIAVVLGLGAILAIFNAVQMAMRARVRETAVMRAIGFRKDSIGLALMVETLLVGLVCALIALLVVWLALHGHAIGTSTASSSISFRFDMTGSVIVATIVYTLVLGFLSALWPIARAVRAPLTQALQDE